MAEPFLHPDFLLSTKVSRRLYHEYAEGLPIFDYHCHLPVAEVADNRQFENLTAIWLAGDHYKWRAMRAFGVEERLITGDAPDWDKFSAWAETVPFTVRNPLYHWTHMELKDPFGISDKLLAPDTAREIYDHCNALLSKEDITKVAKNVPKPLIVNMGLGLRSRSTTPLMSPKELEDIGVAAVAYPRMLSTAALK